MCEWLTCCGIHIKMNFSLRMPAVSCCIVIVVEECEHKLAGNIDCLYRHGEEFCKHQIEYAI